MHAIITFAVAALVQMGAAPASVRVNDVVSALVLGSVFLFAFRIERRNVAFARLSGLARSIYRLRAVLLGMLVVAGAAYYVPWLHLDPWRVVLAAGCILVAGSAWSALTRRLLCGHQVHRVLVVGDGERVGRFLTEFHADPHPDIELVGMLTDTGRGLGDDVEGDTTLDEVIAMFDEASEQHGTRQLGTLDNLETVLAAEAIDTVVVSVRRNRLELFSRLSNWSGNITVQELPAFSEHVFGRVPVDVINAAWFMHMIHPFYRPYSRITKRAGDIIAALLLSLVALPIVPFIALAIKIASPHAPVLFRQQRVGERGREFTLVKFRTMHPNAEAGGARWAAAHDDRIIRGGHFLRRTRLDELPQLWNILCGHMSFVGPRPEVPAFVGQLEQAIPYYQRRHIVKPGLTGWAQVRLGYTDSVDGAANKLGYELYYLKHQSLFLDFVIFVETIRVVLLRFGSR